MCREKGKWMKKLKSLGFAVIYLLIPIVLQLTLSAMISFHIVAVRLLHGVEYDADKLEAWISSAQINMILIMLVNATIIVGVGIWYWYLRKVHQPVKETGRYRRILSPQAIVTILFLAFASQVCVQHFDECISKFVSGNLCRLYETCRYHESENDAGTGNDRDCRHFWTDCGRTGISRYGIPDTAEGLSLCCGSTSFRNMLWYLPYELGAGRVCFLPRSGFGFCI